MVDSLSTLGLSLSVLAVGTRVKMAAPAYLKKYYCTVHSQFVTHHPKYGLNVLAADSYGKLTVFR